ncbi:hypothetical protein CR513_35262, partial [Mucuna pruriens]
MDIAKEEEGVVEGEIMTTFIIMKGVINPLKVVEGEKIEAILVEQMKLRRYDKSNVECYNYHKYDHFSWECSTNVEEKDNLVGDKEALNDDSDNKSLWYLDNGASNHMCGYKEKFVELEEKVRRNVSFGDSSKVQIQVKGTILISLKDGSHKFIKHVYYVPKLRSNILSLGQLVEKGYEILMKENCLWFQYQNSNLVAKVFMSRNRMFMLSIKTKEVKCLKACIKHEAWCWHMRFGHLNFGALKTLRDEKMVKGMPHINHPNQLCKAFFLSKHARRSFPKEVESRTNESLHLVHIDVCGLIDPPSFDLDIFLEVFVILKNFKTFVKKENSYVIKALRSYRGEFNEFCEKDEIHHPLTILRTLQQNGVAERKNRIILNMARCMLKVKFMPNVYWAEAISCAIYLSNRSLIRNVKVFGSIAYAYVPNQGRFKLDDRSVKHVFISYDANSKGYKLYNPSNEKMIVRRDVKFDEKETWNWEKEENTYDLLPYFEEDDQVLIPNEFSTPPLSPTPSIHEASSSGWSSSERRQKMRNIQEIYDKTKIINDLFCLFVDSEPLTFDETMKDKWWRQAMEEEIKVIKKNDT